MGIEEGLTVEGEPLSNGSSDVNSDAGWDAALRAKVGGGGASTTPTEERDAPATTPDADSEAEILAGLRSPASSEISVESGLTVTTPPAEQLNKYGMTASEQAEHLAWAKNYLDSPEAKARDAQSSAGQAAQADHISRVSQAFAEAYLAAEPEAAIRELRALQSLIGVENAMAVKERFQDELADYAEANDLPDEGDDELLGEIWDASLQQSAAEAEQNRQLQAVRHIGQALGAQEQALSQEATAYYKTKGISTEAAQDRLENVVALASELRDLYLRRGVGSPDKILDGVQDLLIEHGGEGVQLEALPPKVFGQVVERLDSWMQAAERETRQGQIRETIFAAPTTSVSEGITTAESETQRLLKLAVGEGTGMTRRTLPPEKVEQESARRVARAADIRRGVAGADNLQRDINAAYEKGTDARARHERDLEEARARSRGLGR